MRRQRGMSLIELMIAMALGMGVALASLALLNAARATYVAVADGALVQDTGRYALDVLSRVIRQANYVPHEHPAFSAFSTADMSALAAGVEGLDNATLNSRTTAFSNPDSNPDNYDSDVLVIRYFGSGLDNKADGGMLNCAGFAVAAPGRKAKITTVNAADKERDWSIFYVAADTTGEPELRCKYITKTDGWNAIAIARGVEAFQVLYGLSDTSDTSDGVVTQYRNAAQISPQQWHQVVAVRIALLIRGEQASGNAAPDAVYAMFGSGYNNPLDPGTTISKFRVPNRTRRLFQSTIQLRNQAP